MELPQTAVGAALLLAGAAIGFMGRRDSVRRDLRTPLMTARGKLMLGFVMIFIGLLVFLSQFAGAPPPGMGMRKGFGGHLRDQPMAVLHRSVLRLLG